MSHHLRFEMLAKSGYVARGVVFLLIAGLALFSGVAGGEADSKSALTSLLQQPFGRIWVGLIGLGLLGFVAWRLAHPSPIAMAWLGYQGQGYPGGAAGQRRHLCGSRRLCAGPCRGPRFRQRGIG